MSKGKYIIPVVMGQPGQELYLVKGNFPRELKTALARYVTRRAVLPADESGVTKATEKCRYDYQAPKFLTELEIVDGTFVRQGKVGRSQAIAIEGFLRNTIPSSKTQSELDGWFLVEKNGDLVPLKLAKFSINLLDDNNKQQLINDINGHGRF